MADVIPIKKWPGGIGELESGDKIPYAFLGIDGQLGGQRNKIINGKMEIAQRGAIITGVSGSAYFVDRMFYGASTTAVVTLSQQLDAPPGSDFQFSARVEVTTASPTVPAGQVVSVQHRVEGYNIRDLVGRTFTLSFWVKSPLAGTHCVSFTNGGFDRTYVAEYTVNAPNTWEFKAITVTGGLPTAGTWNFLDGVGLRVAFTLAVGPTYQTTPGSWQTGNFIGSANQVNFLATVGNVFALTGLQLEVGPVATPFEHRMYGTELMLCQRYYQTGSLEFSGYTVAGTTYLTRQPFPVRMRATPTVTLTSVYGASFPNVAGTPTAGPGGFSESRVASATANAGFFGSQYTASAEI